MAAPMKHMGSACHVIKKSRNLVHKHGFEFFRYTSVKNFYACNQMDIIEFKLDGDVRIQMNEHDKQLFSPHIIEMNHNVDIDSSIQSSLIKGSDHRKHPGIINHKSISLPTALESAITKVHERYPIPYLKEKAQKLQNYIKMRGLPVEEDMIQIKAKESEERINKKAGPLDLTNMDVEEREKQITKRKGLILKDLRKRLYRWQAIRYNAEKGLVYLSARVSEDYGVLYQIFTEISKRNPDFKPHTLFDLGSGIGTVTWAANTVWPNSLYEHLCVDPSDDMHTLARLLLQGGDENANTKFKEMYFRQFFPPSHKNTFNLVVSAYTLFELPSRQERLKTVLNLWRKTHDYLILVEHGSNAGFQCITEARDFIIHLSNTEGKEDSSLIGHVFAPCPHDLSCPRTDGTPCNFKMRNHDFGKKGLKESLYCYVVLKKGRKPEGAVSWPRLVRTVTNRSKRVHCKTCTAAGKLEACVITAKRHGRDLFWCARNSEWGDLLPVIPREETDTKTEDKLTEEDDTTADNILENKDLDTETRQRTENLA